MEPKGISCLGNKYVRFVRLKITQYALFYRIFDDIAKSRCADVQSLRNRRMVCRKSSPRKAQETGQEG